MFDIFKILLSPQRTDIIFVFASTSVIVPATVYSVLFSMIFIEFGFGVKAVIL